MKSASLAALDAAIKILEDSIMEENVEMEANVEQLQLAMEDSCKAMAAIATQYILKKYSNRKTLQPVHRLPPETITRIIDCVLPGFPWSRTLIRASNACRSWRQIVLSTPWTAFWTFIPMDVAPDLISLALNRSGVCGLDIWCLHKDLRTPSSSPKPRVAKNITRFASSIYPYHRRWRTVALIPHFGVLDALKPGIAKALPTLRRFIILGYHPDDPSVGTPFHLQNDQAPDLRRLTIRTTSQPFSFDSLFRLQDLSLQYTRDISLTTIAELLETCADRLTHFKLAHCRTPPSTNPDVRQLDLPELRCLSLENMSPGIVARLMALIRKAPNCSQFKITEIDATGYRDSDEALTEFLRRAFDHHLPTLRNIVSLSSSGVGIGFYESALEVECQTPTSSLELRFRIASGRILAWSSWLVRLLRGTKLGGVPVQLRLRSDAGLNRTDRLDCLTTLYVQEIELFSEEFLSRRKDLATPFLDYLGTATEVNGTATWPFHGVQSLTVALLQSEYGAFKRMLERRYRDFPQVGDAPIAQVQRPVQFNMTCQLLREDEYLRQDLVRILGWQKVSTEVVAERRYANERIVWEE